VPGPPIEVAGQKYQGPQLSLQVLDPSEQDIVVLEMSAKPENVYPLQPFVVTLTLALKPLPEPHTQRDPLSVLAKQMPHLSLPWADDEALPEGVTASEPAGTWLQPILSAGRNAYGFGINNFHTNGGRRYGSLSGGGFGFPGFPSINDLFGDGGFPDPSTMFSMLNDERRAAFLPESRRALREDRQGGMVEYWEYSIKRTFTAEMLGPKAFGPATMKGIFATRVRPGGGLEGERIYALARAITVDVRDAPLAGRPDSYVGAIGRLEATVELTPTQVKVGDPLTLTISMRGDGTLANTTPPKLDGVPAIADAFKVYEATQETETGIRRFTYSLRPRRAGISEFPAVPVSYFDIQQEKYVTIQTEPIAIQVAAANTLADADIAMLAPPVSSTAGPQARTEGVFANITDLSELSDESVRPGRWFLALGGMAGLFFAVALVTNRARHWQSDQVGKRRRNAERRARQRLAEVGKQITTASARQAGDSLNAALTGYIADLAGCEEQGLTSGEVVRHARELSLSPALVSQLEDVLNHCDAARYGAWTKPLDSLHREAGLLLDALVRDLRGRKRVS
jgi:hypothetical protein